jgi:hypothetical protein
VRACCSLASGHRLFALADDPVRLVPADNLKPELGPGRHRGSLVTTDHAVHVRPPQVCSSDTQLACAFLGRFGALVTPPLSQGLQDAGPYTRAHGQQQAPESRAARAQLRFQERSDCVGCAGPTRGLTTSLHDYSHDSLEFDQLKRNESLVCGHYLRRVGWHRWRLRRAMHARAARRRTKRTIVQCTALFR